MNAFDWSSFLHDFSRVLARQESIRARLPPDVRASGWLGFPAASPEEIARAEARLHTTFPPSYRTFLAVSNGWRQTGHFIDRLWAVEQVDWFVARHRDWADSHDDFPVSDEEYFVYGAEQSSLLFRPAYLRSVLEISEEGDAAIYLLNPQVVAREGEWEAWFFANWLPGATRYRSFQELMQAEYAQALDLYDDS